MPALAPMSRLIDVLTDLYDSVGCCPDLEAHAAAQNIDPAERKLFEALAKARHAAPGQSREDTLNSKEWKNLYRYVANQLTGAAEKGYGKELVKLDFDTPDHRMLSKLTEGLHWFSANKNWQLLVDLNAQLKTTDGKLREWADFKKEALRLDKQYNTVCLRFDTAGDRRVRPAHVLLDGITLPASDPFWSKYFPPLDWNCRCDVTEVLRSRAKRTDLQQKGPLPQIAEGFKSNVGKSGLVFDESHPYFTGVPSSEAKILRQLSDAEAYQLGISQQYADDVKTVFDPKRAQMEWAQKRVQGPRYSKVMPELSVQEKAILHDYTRDGYQVNKALRGSSPMREFESSYERLLNRALSKLPDYQGKVFRRVDLKPQLIAKYKPGQQITEKAFSSTSFVRSDDFDGNVEFIINSRTGKNIRDISELDLEDEVLLRSNTAFKVLNVEPGKVTRIYLDEIIVP